MSTLTQDEHYRALESMYLAAPVNEAYAPKIQVREGEAEISIELNPTMYHSAGAVHGSIYFHLLDSAAFFAANSLEQEVFVLTSSFTTYLTRPITKGTLKATGRVVNQTKNQWLVEAVATNEGKEVARGSGVFVRGKLLLREARGYLRERG